MKIQHRFMLMISSIALLLLHSGAAIELQEIVVRPLIEEYDDQIIYNITADPLRKSSSIGFEFRLNLGKFKVTPKNSVNNASVGGFSM